MMKTASPVPNLPAGARPVSRFASDGWVLAGLSVLFWILAALIWGRVGEVVTDGFNDLTAVMRMEAGERLYRELQWLHGPVPPALVYAVRALSGRTVNAYLGLCAVTAWAEWALAWRLVRRFSGPMGAVAAVLVIWGFFTFEPDGFARLLPVNYSSLLSAALVLVVFNLLADDARSPAQRISGRFLLAAAAVTVTLLSKVEFGLAVWAALLIHGALNGPHPARLARLTLATTVPAAIYGAVCFSLPGFWETTAPGAVASNSFGRAYLMYGGSIVSLLTAGHFVAIVLTSSALFLGLAGFVTAALERRWRLSLLWAAGAVLVIALVNVPDPLQMHGSWDARLALRITFAFVVPGLLWGLWRGYVNPDERWCWPLFAGALFLLARNPNQLLPERYGAFYLVPALVLSARPLLDLVARLQQARRDGQLAPRRPVRGDLVFVLLLLPAAVHGASETIRFHMKTYSLGEATEPVRTYSKRGVPLRSAIDYLKSRLRPGDRLAIVPNEPVIYYATGALPAWPDHNYIGHLVRGDDEAKLAGLAMSRARFVVFSSWEYKEFGVARAGAGFAETLKQRLGRDGKFLMEFASDMAAYRVPDKPKGQSEPFYRVKIWEIPPAGIGQLRRDD